MKVPVVLAILGLAYCVILVNAIPRPDQLLVSVNPSEGSNLLEVQGPLKESATDEITSNEIGTKGEEGSTEGNGGGESTIGGGEAGGSPLEEGVAISAEGAVDKGSVGDEGTNEKGSGEDDEVGDSSGEGSNSNESGSGKTSIEESNSNESDSGKSSNKGSNSDESGSGGFSSEGSSSDEKSGSEEYNGGGSNSEGSGSGNSSSSSTNYQTEVVILYFDSIIQNLEGPVGEIIKQLWKASKDGLSVSWDVVDDSTKVSFKAAKLPFKLTWDAMKPLISAGKLAISPIYPIIAPFVFPIKFVFNDILKPLVNLVKKFVKDSRILTADLMYKVYVFAVKLWPQAAPSLRKYLIPTANYVSPYQIVDLDAELNGTSGSSSHASSSSSSRKKRETQVKTSLFRRLMNTLLTTPLNLTFDLFNMGMQMGIDGFEILEEAVAECRKMRISSMPSAVSIITDPFNFGKSIVCYATKNLSNESEEALEISLKEFWAMTTKILLPALDNNLQQLAKTGILPPDLDSIINDFHQGYMLVKLLGIL
ncbi:uncharacterized protein [Prorops nasuta]|uniref:uncharacterized protein isoform X1 n=1 Tax=Prorops nasuta TaxID=863751 RepID=UPI0034CDFB43